MRRLLLPVLAALACCVCGSAVAGSASSRVPARVDLSAAARKLLAARTAHVVYDLRIEPPHASALQFVTHAVGDLDFAHGSFAYTATTPLGEATRTIVVGGRRWTRSLGGGAAGAGNAPTGWRRVSGPDLSPAGLASLAPLAAEGARAVVRTGPREYRATVDVGRLPRRARAIESLLGSRTGVARFVLDARGRLVAVRLLNTTLVPGRMLVYAYSYSRLGEPVRLRPPGR